MKNTLMTFFFFNNHTLWCHPEDGSLLFFLRFLPNIISGSFSCHWLLIGDLVIYVLNLNIHAKLLLTMPIAIQIQMNNKIKLNYPISHLSTFYTIVCRLLCVKNSRRSAVSNVPNKPVWHEHQCHGKSHCAKTVPHFNAWSEQYPKPFICICIVLCIAVLPRNCLIV